jgi:hypothetical protein
MSTAALAWPMVIRATDPDDLAWLSGLTQSDDLPPSVVCLCDAASWPAPEVEACCRRLAARIPVTVLVHPPLAASFEDCRGVEQRSGSAHVAASLVRAVADVATAQQPGFQEIRLS